VRPDMEWRSEHEGHGCVCKAVSKGMGEPMSEILLLLSSWDWIQAAAGIACIVAAVAILKRDTAFEREG